MPRGVASFIVKKNANIPFKKTHTHLVSWDVVGIST